MRCRKARASKTRASSTSRISSAYESAPGLITKYYVFGNGKGGGIYLWESREAAERFYTPEWRAMIAKKYKGAGEIEWLENPVTVDNRARKAKAA